MLARGVSTYIFLSRQTQSSTQKVLQMRFGGCAKILKTRSAPAATASFFSLRLPTSGSDIPPAYIYVPAQRNFSDWQPPFLFARSRVLCEREDGENGRTKPDDLGELRWIAASAMTDWPRTRTMEWPATGPVALTH